MVRRNNVTKQCYSNLRNKDEMHVCAYDRGEGETRVFAEIFSWDIGEYQ